MKKKLLSMVSLIGMFAYTSAQVGINTTSPATTLEVVGDPTITTKTDGIIAPRITGDQLKAKNLLYNNAQNGTLIYVTAPDTTVPLAGKTINVSSTGYYYYDAPNNVWLKAAIASEEPWQVSGTETKATSNSENIYQRGLVSVGDFRTLTVGNLAKSAINVLGTGAGNDDVKLMSYSNNASSGSIIMEKTRGTFAIPNLLVANDFIGGISFNGYTRATDGTALYNNSSSIDALVETNTTVTDRVPSALRFRTLDIERLRITNTGNVGIGTATPANKLEITQTGGSGLRFTNLKSAPFLGTDTNGDVIAIATPPTINLYTADGALLTGRIVNMDGKRLSFTNSSGTEVNNQFSIDGNTFSVDAAANRIGIGTTAPVSKLHIVGNDDIADRSEITLNNSSDLAAGYSRITLNRTRGNSGARTAAQVGDITGAIDFQGLSPSVTNGFQRSASIRATVTAINSGNVAQNLGFYTGQDNNNLLERLRLNNVLGGTHGSAVVLSNLAIPAADVANAPDYRSLSVNKEGEIFVSSNTVTETAASYIAKKGDNIIIYTGTTSVTLPSDADEGKIITISYTGANATMNVRTVSGATTVVLDTIATGLARQYLYTGTIWTPIK